MFDFIFEIVCGDKYNVMVLTAKDGVLYGIPCEECMSGDYPNFGLKMKAVMAELKGKADSNLIKEVVRSYK